jgi:hypothetical protein
MFFKVPPDFIVDRLRFGVEKIPSGSVVPRLILLGAIGKETVFNEANSEDLKSVRKVVTIRKGTCSILSLG